MYFLLHVGEPLFHCVQRHRFVGVRGCHDRRVTFLPVEGADENLNKILMTEIFLSLRISVTKNFVDRSDNGDLNICKFI
jgi:hypothetical protein